MGNEKEKEIDFKPSKWLYIFLFIYYSIWLFQSYGAISFYLTFGFDTFHAYGLIDWLCFGLFIFAGIYSFYAVIKTLRGDKDCITSIKWSLMLVFFYTLMDPTRGQIPTYDTLTWYAVFLLRPFFYLIFYLYLCFARGIKRRFPKAEREFGPSGWIWSGLMIAFLGVGVYGCWQQYNISKYCEPIDVSSLNLKQGEVCDGYILFNSERKWEKRTEAADTLYNNERLTVLPTIQSADSICKIYIASVRCNKSDARTYNQVIFAYLGSRSKIINSGEGTMKELSFTDTVISGNRVMSTIYETKIDSVPTYLDVAMITEVKSPKCCVIVRTDKIPIEPNWAVNFAKDVQFDLQKVAQGKDNENCSDTKNKNSNRTAKYEQETDADLLSTSLHRVFPRHLLRVMTLKDHERKITYRNCKYVF